MTRLFALSLCLFLAISQVYSAQGKDRGEFAGAVWGFKMTPKIKGLGVMRGQYRAEKNVLYQQDSEEDKAFSKTVGKNFPNRKGDHTRVEFTDLSAVGKGDKMQTGIKGVAKLTYERGGEWDGEFIDSEGRHWDIHCSRIRE